MLLVSFVALSVLAGPAERVPESAPPSSSAEVRLAQDEFGDPPPPPPPVGEDIQEAPPPPAPPDLEEPAAPPGPTKKKRSSEDSDEDEDDTEEGGFVDTYFPFSLTEGLHPSVDEALWSFWVGSLIPCVPFGQIWLPLVMIEEDMPDGYLVEAIIIYITHVAPHVLLSFVGVPLMMLGAIPWIGWLVFLPCGLLCNGINLVTLAANVLWLMPVALANSLDRNLKVAEGSSSEDAWLYRRRDRTLASAPMAY